MLGIQHLTAVTNTTDRLNFVLLPTHTSSSSSKPGIILDDGIGLSWSFSHILWAACRLANFLDFPVPVNMVQTRYQAKHYSQNVTFTFTSSSLQFPVSESVRDKFKINIHTLKSSKKDTKCCITKQVISLKPSFKMVSAPAKIKTTFLQTIGQRNHHLANFLGKIDCYI